MNHKELLPINTQLENIVVNLSQVNGTKKRKRPREDDNTTQTTPKTFVLLGPAETKEALEITK